MAYSVQPERQTFLEAAQHRVKVVWDQAKGGRQDDAPDTTEAAPPRRRGWKIAGAVGAALLVAILLFMAFFDWDYLRGPVARFASGQIGRPVAIDGHLRVKLLTWTPTATVERLRIANPPDRPGNMALIDRLTVSVKLTSLFRGKPILPLVQAERPTLDLYRKADGANNWTFKGKSPGDPARLPAIQRFEINDGRLRIEDGVRKLTFVGTMSSREVMGAQTTEGFRLLGDGKLNSEPFNLRLTGGPLINVDPDRPYPFDADVHAGATRILAKGSITKPFDFGVLKTSLDVTGPDMADLYYLTGLTLPNTPPYKVSGSLTREGRVFRYTGVNGRMGDTDLHGWIGVKTAAGKRPMLTGEVTSKVLAFKDLEAVMGGGSTNAKAGPVKASQVQAAQTMRATGRLLPDAPIAVDRLRNMDADVTYRAQTIRADRFPVRSGSVHITLDNALLKLNELTLTLPQGRIAGQMSINGRQATPAVDLDMRMTGASLQQFLPPRFKDNSVTASLVGRAKLHGVGKSVHDAASSASGSLTVVAPHGEIRKAFAELMGVNVVKGLGLLLSKNQEKTDIRCAVADFQARNGVLYANRLVFDTGPVLVSGGGTINLRDETMNLQVKGKPKEFRLVRLIVPVHVEGNLRSPKVRAETGTAIGQVGIGAALGTLLAPLAAILPFVDSGLAKDANCSALMAG